MRVTFFRVAERKSPKKGRPYCARPFAALRATCGARTGGAPQNSLRATRSVQTTAASQCTKCVCPSAHARTPCPALLGTRRREPQNGHPHGPLLRCAALGPVSRAHAPRAAQARPSAAMARMDVGYSAVRMSHPCWLRLRRGGCGVSMGVGAPMLRELTRRGCLNEAAPQRSEFHGAPRSRHDAGLPRSEAQGSQTGGRLFFGDFLLAKQKKVTRSPGDSRLPHSKRACGSRRTKASTGPTRTDGARTNYKNNSCQRFIY
ncbi:hypothetical protein J2W88_001045 [Acidovorax delafieldii]|uniref:Uncharacterized protein n=1 Tax=Acidovorax delafieldii TaxID=47920 RepID=A0AAJ2BP48_ACIDE|nr:hypothetical protein [Acidovorax delafieldii]MDR6836224.1 hypothetical protein [Acidovorax delafieldii]MDR7364805.1 hypothetical protein [Acidovorax delafieldii]